MTAIIIDTVGACLDRGYGVTMFCTCGHFAAIDLAALAERRGRDLVITGSDRVVLRGRCGKCGAVTTTSRISLIGVPFSEHFRNKGLT